MREDLPGSARLNALCLGFTNALKNFLFIDGSFKMFASIFGIEAKCFALDDLGELDCLSIINLKAD